MWGQGVDEDVWSDSEIIQAYDEALARYKNKVCACAYVFHPFIQINASMQISDVSSMCK